MQGENVKKGKKRRQNVKHFHNNADLCYKIKHGGRFGEIG